MNILIQERDTLESTANEWMKHKAEAGIKANDLREKKDSEPFTQLKQEIISNIPSNIDEKKKSSSILEKLIYLRNLDNLCNVILNKSKNVPAAQISQNIAKHMKWISVLKEIKYRVDQGLVSNVFSEHLLKSTSNQI